jgi:endonuclease-3
MAHKIDRAKAAKSKRKPQPRSSRPHPANRRAPRASVKKAEKRAAADRKAAAGALPQWTTAEIEEAFRRFAGVNKATPALFAAADTPAKMLALGEQRVQDLIKTIGLYRTKARNLIALSRKLVEEHGGAVPRSREALEALPGVGRKTANVVLNVAFGEATIAVDTHIFRVGNRTGLATGKTPFEVETKLEAVVPARYKRHAHHWLILHGRYVCVARRPLCERCLIADLCKWPGKTLPMPAAPGLDAPLAPRSRP